MKLRTSCCLTLLIFSLFPVFPQQSPESSPGPKRILILHSYNQRYNWVDSITRGIEANIATLGWDVWFEYMDTKNLTSGFSMQLFANLYQKKYQKIKFDLIVTVDDPAYAFFIQFRNKIFNDAAVLAIGLNAAAYHPEPKVSYFLENPDYGKTLNIALRQFPAAKTLHIVLDKTITGLYIKQRILSAPLSPKIAIDWIDEGSSQEIARKIQAIPKGDILVYGVYFNPVDGYVSNDRVFQRIAAGAQVPIYTFWNFNLDFGAFGGYTYDGYKLGQASAQIIQDLINRDGQVIYRTDTMSNWVFDWKQAKNFGINDSSFPADTRFINKPDNSIVLNQTAIIILILVFVIIASILVLILIALRSQRSLLAFREHLIATQRELMLNLGNVIENRSPETASHVERITTLSLFVADHLQLPPEKRLQLEICAPMHDIGKVGIPDHILKKPGKLTPEEFEIMKTHTTLGYSIFKSSPNPMIQAAARIALEHHERWDGTGYPNGRLRDDIDILAQIVSITDVCDALLSERIYKAAWRPELVVDYVRDQSGKMFNPRLAAIVLDNWPEFHALYVGAFNH